VRYKIDELRGKEKLFFEKSFLLPQTPNLFKKLLKKGIGKNIVI